jgi:hypothetical protein
MERDACHQSVVGRSGFGVPSYPGPGSYESQPNEGSEPYELVRLTFVRL